MIVLLSNKSAINSAKKTPVSESHPKKNGSRHIVVKSK